MTDKISQGDAAEAIRLLREMWAPGAVIPVGPPRPVRALLAKYPPGPALQRCPHCGGVNVVLDEQSDDYGWTEKGWMAVCDVNRGGCGASGGFRRDKAEAVRVWNRRS